MDSEAKKLFNGGKWAANATDNIDPDSSAITPTLVRTAGFPLSYSQAGGNVPDRRRINQLFRELSGAAFEIVHGISPYDNEVNYPLHAITQADGRLYRAIVANGPATSNTTHPTTPNNTVWEGVSGALTVPDAPRSIVFDNSAASEITVRWKAGRDNGAAIDSWQFQSRTSSDGVWVPATPTALQYAEATVTGLTPNTRLFVRAAAVNSQGRGAWAEDDTGEVVTGTKPGGGATLGLLATAGDTQVSLKWLEPSNGGSPILRYVVQWRDGTQNFSSGRQATVSGSLTHTVQSLTNDTLYYFRVAAVNAIDQGDWSNVAQATPESETVTVFHPGMNAPALNLSTASRITANTSLINSTQGITATVTGTDWGIKKTSSSTWTETTPAERAGQIQTRIFTGLDGNTDYDVRYRVYSAANTSPVDWSPITTGRVLGAVPGAPTVNGTAWWRVTNPIGGGHVNAGMTITITPSTLGGSPVTGYVFDATFVNQIGVNTFTFGSPVITTDNPYSGRFALTGTPKFGSTFRIRAAVRNANGQGPFGQSALLTVGGDNPFNP